MIMQRDFPLIGYADLPVLRVRAGSVTARRKYVDQLMSALQQRALTCTCVQLEESAPQYREEILALVRQYDLVIVDEEIDAPLPDGLLLPGEHQQLGTADIEHIIRRMDMLVCRSPVWACILIGGKSSRMGQPKHLIEDTGKRTWLEKEMKILAPRVDKVVVSGAGRLPEKLGELTRLDDIAGVAGPLTGIVAAMRWQPMVSWLLVACDMPHLSRQAIQWLLNQRHAGCWGLVPQLAGSTRAEPLLAWYDYRAGPLFEEQLVRNNLRIGAVAAHPRIGNPVIPEHLQQSWQNINTPDQLSAAFGHKQ